jgi:putative nucleotidyltransferase with HDIG domain
MLRKDNSNNACMLQSKIISSIEAFAPLPSVAMRVLDMVADSETSAADLEGVLRSDVSLVTSVLKLANSAFYGVRRQVDSLRHALLLLGKSEVQSLVLSRVMFQAFKNPKRVQKRMMVEVWKHSLECALAAESIAQQLGEEDSIFFLGGMLHDIGKLVVIQKFLEEVDGFDHYDMLDKEDGLGMELEILGCGHDELGAMLLHRWMFPEELERMVRVHHDYTGIGSCNRVEQILILANLLCRWVVAQDLLEKGEVEEGSIDTLRGILLRAGGVSGIVSSAGSLVRMEHTYREYLIEKAELLEMLQM